jgi:hypothetical protein
VFNVYIIPLSCPEPVVPVFRIPSVPQAFVETLLPLVDNAVVMVTFAEVNPSLDEFFGDRAWKFETIGVTHAAC